MTQSATLPLAGLLQSAGHFIAIPADAERVGTGIYAIGIRPSFAIAEAEKATRTKDQFIALPATKRLYERIEVEGFNNLAPAFRYGLVDGIADILGPATFHVFEREVGDGFVGWLGTAQANTALSAAHAVISERGPIPTSRTRYVAVESDEAFESLFLDQGDGRSFKLAPDKGKGTTHLIVFERHDFEGEDGAAGAPLAS